VSLHVSASVSNRIKQVGSKVGYCLNTAKLKSECRLFHILRNFSVQSLRNFCPQTGCLFGERRFARASYMLPITMTTMKITDKRPKVLPLGVEFCELGLRDRWRHWLCRWRLHEQSCHTGGNQLLRRSASSQGEVCAVHLEYGWDQSVFATLKNDGICISSTVPPGIWQTSMSLNAPQKQSNEWSFHCLIHRLSFFHKCVCLIN